MKKILSLFLLASLCISLSAAQKKEKSSSKDNAPTVIYSLPKTVLVLEVEASKITEVPGPYFNYSDRYLAMKDVVTERKTYWEITNIRVISKAVPDKNKTFQLESGVNNNVTLTKEGLICGINYPCSEMNDSSWEFKKKAEPAVLESFDNMVLTEEQLVANSTARMAENAAKQIYRIRDSRLSLITGDNEKVPADGESLKLMLKKLDLAEQSFVELFSGKKTKITITKEIEVAPEKGMKNEVLFRFSTLSGIVDKDDLSGSPIYMSVTSDKNALPSASIKKASGFFYNIPVKAKIEIGFGDKIYFDEIVAVSQFGSVQALPTKVTKKGKVRYEPKTGSIISIEK